MEENDWILPLNVSEIPPIFRSDDTGEPFSNCIKCDRYLLDEGTLYLIEKAFKSYVGFDSRTTIFEYAMCMDCVQDMQKELSVSSRNNIDAFFAKQTDFDKRRERLKDNWDVQNWIQNCIVTDNKPVEGGEFQIYGQCDGAHFMYYDFPYMISGEVIDQMIDLMSDKTIDELNNFKNNITQGPPEFQELLNSGGVRVFV